MDETKGKSMMCPDCDSPVAVGFVEPDANGPVCLLAKHQAVGSECRDSEGFYVGAEHLVTEALRRAVTILTARAR